jgi:hypothetical protein
MSSQRSVLCSYFKNNAIMFLDNEWCLKHRYIYRVSDTIIYFSTEGAEFVWVSECQKGEGCEIINQFVFV